MQFPFLNLVVNGLAGLVLFFIAGLAQAQSTEALTTCTEESPQIFSCRSESSYLTKLTELGYGTFLEGFEGAEWDGVRSTFDATNSAAEITSQGIIWTSNHPGTNNITTGTGPAFSGTWGAYDPGHGVATGTTTDCDIDNPPHSCLFHDGLSGRILSGGDSLRGVGAYITGTAGANIDIILDGVTRVSIGKLPDTGFHFLAVIDATVSGFTAFEFQEQDGKVGQERQIFGDNFIITTSGDEIRFQMNTGLNDAWYNPDTQGQGFFITVFPELGYVSLSWFTYDTVRPDEAATANLGEPGHRWLNAVGTYTDNQAVMDISFATGGLFDTQTEISEVYDGTIILTLTDCKSGTVEYDMPSIDRQGVVPIQRVADDNIMLCETFNTN
jgi:hypothetical protein